MSTAVIFWTILGSVVGIGCIFVLVAYLVWRCYLHPRSKVDEKSFFEEITETEIKTVTSHPPDGATVVTQNVRTRTRSSRPRDRRRGSKDIDAIANQTASTMKTNSTADGPILVTTWNVPSLMNNWRESEEDFIKVMSKSNFRQLPWKAPFSMHSPRVSKTLLNNQEEDKIEIIELT